MLGPGLCCESKKMCRGFCLWGACCVRSGAVPCGGLERLPFFGMLASKWTFYINLTPNIIGAGMICECAGS